MTGEAAVGPTPPELGQEERQRGVFTLHPDPERSYEPDAMIKWVIPRERCFDFRVMLDTCGINQASLFPDLEGLGLHLGWCYKYERLA